MMGMNGLAYTKQMGWMEARMDEVVSMEWV